MSMREDLKLYADFIQKIRSHLSQQNVVEVQTNSLLNTPTTDVYIDSIRIGVNKDLDLEVLKYLHTSPELEMKKLISQGSGDIYQICQVFRDNEIGKDNSNEFSMLEYYRMGFSIHDLMDDIANLLLTVGINKAVNKLSYEQAFKKFANIDILNLSFKELKDVATKHGLTTDFDYIEDLQIFLFTALCESKLKDLEVCFIYDFPALQSALSKVEGKVAKRFELYIDGLEIANGYDELQTHDEYLNIFKSDLAKRQKLQKPVFDLDTNFLQQLEKPLEQCSGVAIGINRLFSIKKRLK